GSLTRRGTRFRPPDLTVKQYANLDRPGDAHASDVQVLREKFDEVLLRHSEKCGAGVLEGHRLLDAVFDRDGVTLRFADRLGGNGTLRAGVVVDASGRAAVLVKGFARHEHDPLLLDIAVNAQS